MGSSRAHEANMSGEKVEGESFEQTRNVLGLG